MKPTLSRLFGLLLLAFTLLAAGCGGGGSTPPPATPPPVISSFTATPTAGFGGQPCTLSWAVSGATRVTLDNGGGDVTGLSSKVVYPMQTTTYTLTASNAGGERTASVSIAINDSVVVPTTTKVLDNSTMQSLSNVTSNGSVLTFSQTSSALQALRSGDHIVAGVTNATPNGLLRKVSTVSQSGSQVTVTTTAGTLEDAITKCDIVASRQLSPSDVAQATALSKGISIAQPQSLRSQAFSQMAEGFHLTLNDVVLYDDDGNLNTDNDQITASGTIAFNPSFDFVFKLDGARIKELRYSTTLTKTKEIEVSAKISKDFNKKFEIPGARWYFNPIVVWAGWVPVVIQPILTVNIGFDGEIFAGITSGVTQTTSLSLGLSYANGSWSPIRNYTNDFEFTPPRLSVGCNFKAYAGPQLNLLLYGIVGPYAEVRAYAELDADIFRTPWWQLYGGLEADVGIRVEILGKKVINDYEFPAAIGYRRLLAEASQPPQSNGTITGIVKNAINNSGLAGVTANAYQGATLAGTATTNANGTYTLALPAITGYRIEFVKQGFITSTYNNISVTSNQTSYLEAVMQIDTAHSGNGSISGKVVNALTGVGVGNVSLKFRNGINTTSGTIYATRTTDGTGAYSVTNMPAGNYTVEMTCPGYNGAYMTVLCVGSMTLGNQNGTISPQLAEGVTRIVLTWGASPSDLDSHLTGPIPGSTERFHVSYYARSFALNGTTYADLDLDDISSYGPETTTIRQQIGGTYRFSVHDWSNKSSNNSNALSASGARVQVYRGGSLVATFNVPPGVGGTLWTVFEMSGSTITPINTMTYKADETTITSVGNLLVTDSAEIQAAPVMK